MARMPKARRGGTTVWGGEPVDTSPGNVLRALRPPPPPSPEEAAEAAVGRIMADVRAARVRRDAVAAARRTAERVDAVRAKLDGQAAAGLTDAQWVMLRDAPADGTEFRPCMMRGVAATAAALRRKGLLNAGRSPGGFRLSATGRRVRPLAFAARGVPLPPAPAAHGYGTSP